MKKKIKDLTVREISEFCKKYSCPKCPLFGIGLHVPICGVSFDLFAIHSALESILNKEIEIPDEPVVNTDQLEEEEEANG